jgi:hypothetical protein
MSEADEMRYRLMGEIAGKEIKSQIDLKTLVEDLENLFYSVDKKDAKWGNSFIENWWILEEFNAVFFDGENPLLFNESLNKINKIRENLVALIALKT